MINEAAFQAVQAARTDSHFTRPLYNSYCFSQIPAAIEYLLTGIGQLGLPPDVLGDFPRRYDKVILLFIDAFGWRFFEQYHESYPFLKRFVTEGTATILTSQFPSTTAAHVTTIHSGLPVGETGVYEWFYYEPTLDGLISPLVFSWAGDSERETIHLPQGVRLTDLFPQSTIYQRLAQQGIKSYIFQPRGFAYGTYSAYMTAGAKAMPYTTFSEALVKLSDALLAEPGRAYFHLYFGDLDSIGHHYGPVSRHFEAEADTFLHAVEAIFHAALSNKLKNTLLLVTADHGQVEVSPQNTLYLNQAIPAIRRFIRTNDNGQLLVPAGSARDLFLYIEDEHLDEASDLLSRHPQLHDKARVCLTQDLIEQGYFGRPSEKLRERVGNLVILPYAGEAVWWYRPGKFEHNFYGHHGGLTPAEMETILLALPYDR